MFRLLVVLAAITGASGEADATPRRANAIQDAAGNIEGAAGAVGNAASQAGGAVANEAGQIAGSVGGALSAGETATVAAGLQASGQCENIWKVVPDITDLLEPKFPKIAATLQGSADDPTQDPAVCQQAVSEQVNAVINDELVEGKGLGSGQLLVWERQAAGNAAWNACVEVCGDVLKKTLSDNEGIRTSNPHQYKNDIVLKLHTALPGVLNKEIGTFCPAPQRLFSLRKDLFAAPATGTTLRLAAVTMGAAGLLLLFAAGALGVRRFAAARQSKVLYTNVANKEGAVSLATSQP